MSRRCLALALAALATLTLRAQNTITVFQGARVIVGDGKVYTSRSEAEGALKTVKVCESGGTVGGPAVVPATPR